MLLALPPTPRPPLSPPRPVPLLISPSQRPCEGWEQGGWISVAVGGSLLRYSSAYSRYTVLVSEPFMLKIRL